MVKTKTGLVIVLTEFISDVFGKAFRLDQGYVPYYLFGRNITTCTYKFQDVRHWSWIEWSAQYVYMDIVKLEFAEYLSVTQPLARLLRIEAVRLKENRERDPSELGDSYDMLFRKVSMRNALRAKICGDETVLESVNAAYKFDSSCAEFVCLNRRARTRLGREILYGELFRVLKSSLTRIGDFDQHSPPSGQVENHGNRSSYSLEDIENWEKPRYVYYFYFAIIRKRFYQDERLLTLIYELCPELEAIQNSRSLQTNWMDNPDVSETAHFDSDFNQRIEDVYFEIIKDIVK